MKLKDMNRQELIEYIGKLHKVLDDMIVSLIEALKLLHKEKELNEIKRVFRSE